MADSEVLESILEHAACLPIFPLEGMVLIPDTIIPLHVFEPRYVQLVDDAMKTHKLICMPNLRMARKEGPVPDIHSVAGVGRIVKKMELPDKRYFIILKGVATVDIEAELECEHLYRQVKTTVRSKQNEVLSSAAQGEIRLMLQSLLLHGANKIKQLKQITEFLELPEFRVEELNALAGGCVRHSKSRQTYLESSDLVEKIELVTNGLADALVAVMDDSD